MSNIPEPFTTEELELFAAVADEFDEPAAVLDLGRRVSTIQEYLIQHQSKPRFYHFYGHRIQLDTIQSYGVSSRDYGDDPRVEIHLTSGCMVLVDVKQGCTDIPSGGVDMMLREAVAQLDKEFDGGE